jgi:integrase
MKFTQRSIDALSPAESDTVFWDDELPGFGVRVKSTGAKAYIIQYRIGRRSRRMTVGGCAVFKLEQARKRARKHLVSAKDGIDPLAEREAARYAPTVQGLAERYLAEHACPHKKASSIAADRRNLENHIIPVLGRLTVKDVTRADIDRLKMKVAGGRTARDEKVGPRARRIVRGGPGAANRCLALLSKMFHLAERWGVRPDGSNPVRHVVKHKEGKRERFLSAEELARLGALLAERDRARRDPASVTAAIRLLIFTGARLSEVLTARWEQLDAERGALALPDSKTGRKTIHLNAPALAVLAGLDRSGGSPWVIPSADRTKPLQPPQKAWQHIRKAVGLDNVRLHDLRHSYASAGAAGGYSLPIIGALLGHTSAATTARYAHLANDPVRQASDAIGAQLAAAMAGSGGEVVPLRRKAI